MSRRINRNSTFWTFRYHASDGSTTHVSIDAWRDGETAHADFLMTRPDGSVTSSKASAPIAIDRDTLGGNGRILHVTVGDALDPNAGFSRSVIGAIEDWAGRIASDLAHPRTVPARG